MRPAGDELLQLLVEPHSKGSVNGLISRRQSEAIVMVRYEI